MFSVKSLFSQLLFSTARIHARAPDGKESIGTGFFFNFKTNKSNSFVPVLVTNKHVVEGMSEARLLLHRGRQGPDGDEPLGTSFTINIQNLNERIFQHPNNEVDLCMMLIADIHAHVAQCNEQLFFRAVHEDNVPDEATGKTLLAIEDVLMIGYPTGLWDQEHNLPIARRGITASHPAVPFNNKPWGLVDIASFPGSSGSPILIANQGSYTGETSLTLGSRCWLLGVLFGYAEFTAEGELDMVRIPTVPGVGIATNIPMHLGYYVRASEILAMKSAIFAKLGVTA